MTSRERLLAAMRFEKVDRVPVAPFGMGKLPAGSDIMAELLEKTDPFIESGVPGDWIFGTNCETTIQKDGDTTTVTRRTPLGDLIDRHRTTDITTACVEFAFKTPEDAKKFLSIDYVAPEVTDTNAFFACKSEIGEQGLVLCGMADAVLVPAILLSPEDFCLWWADYPDLLLEITNVASQRLNDWVEKLCKAGIDAFRIVGGEYASVQLGPKGFDALVLEQDKQLMDIIHSYGAVAYYHNHGPVMNFMSRFREIGMDALDPLEAPPWGDADLKEARAICGDKVAFVGNMDDMEILDKRSTQEVSDLARELLAAAGDRGFILGGTASATYSEHAARNFIALVDVVESVTA